MISENSSMTQRLNSKTDENVTSFDTRDQSFFIAGGWEQGLKDLSGDHMVFRVIGEEISRHQQSTKYKEGLNKTDCQLTAGKGEGSQKHIGILLMGDQ